MSLVRLTPLAYDDERILQIQAEFLYRLLAERPPEANISHKALPPFWMHMNFVKSQPYAAWYVVERNEAEDWGPTPVGSVYLTHPGQGMLGDEIGIAIAESHRGNGYGREAVRLLMEAHPRPKFFANIAPRNLVSQEMFQKLGFRSLQMTYVREAV